MLKCFYIVVCLISECFVLWYVIVFRLVLLCSCFLGTVLSYVVAFLFTLFCSFNILFCLMCIFVLFVFVLCCVVWICFAV